MDKSLINLSPAELAAKCINQTNKPVFLTGKAGTGKTTFLRNIIEKTHKNTIIVAPTGIAAINAGGVTIHSQFQLPFGMYVPSNEASSSSNYQVKVNTPYSVIKSMQMSDRKRAMLREVELLIIDEVSMLRADLLDGIDMILKYVRPCFGINNVFNVFGFWFIICIIYQCFILRNGIKLNRGS